jgi:hypothetical protein
MRSLTILRGAPFTVQGKASATVLADDDATALATLAGSYSIVSVQKSDGNSYGVAFLDDAHNEKNIRQQWRSVVEAAPLPLRTRAGSLLHALGPRDANASLTGLRFDCLNLENWNSYGASEPLRVVFEIERVHPDARLTVGALAALLEQWRAALAMRSKWQQVAAAVQRQWGGCGAAITELGTPCVDSVAERDRIQRLRAFQDAIGEYCAGMLEALIAAERHAVSPRELEDDEEREARQRRRERRRRQGMGMV